ncbi:MAG: hypothetical protein ACP5UT_12820 [Bryobacteraceae bacterium]
MTAPPAQTPPSAPGSQGEPLTWFEKLSYLLYVLMSLEVGLFLLVYPWLGNLWSQNFFFDLVPEWRPIFLNNYVRGAVSGLGVLNLYIGAWHTRNLRRVLLRRDPRAATPR